MPSKYSRIGPSVPESVFQFNMIVGCSVAAASARVHPEMMSLPSLGLATRASSCAETGWKRNAPYK